MAAAADAAIFLNIHEQITELQQLHGLRPDQDYQVFMATLIKPLPVVLSQLSYVDGSIAQNRGGLILASCPGLPTIPDSPACAGSQGGQLQVWQGSRLHPQGLIAGRGANHFFKKDLARLVHE